MPRPRLPLGLDVKMMKVFMRQVDLQDLRVSISAWEPASENALPPWEMVARAAVRTKEKYEPLRKMLKQEPAEVQAAAGGAVATLTINLGEDVGRRSLSVFRVEQPPGNLPAALLKMVPRCCIMQSALGYLPLHIAKWVSQGVPLFCWGTTLEVAEHAVALEKLVPNLFKVVIPIFLKMQRPQLASRYNLQQQTSTIFFTDPSVVKGQVYTCPCLGWRLRWMPRNTLSPVRTPPRDLMSPCTVQA